MVAGVDFYTPGTTADGVPATQARLSYPTDLALAPDGTLYFAERDAYRIRRIAPDGIVWTVAGTGIRGLTGDGGPATLAQIGFVLGLALGGDGSLYISADGHIRRVRPDGLIMRFAGYGTSTSDGAQAMQSAMNPAGIAVAPDGSVYVTDPSANKVRRIGVDGTIRTVAGTGAFGSAGDGNLATLATLNQPSSVLAGDSFGSFVVADGSKVRSVGSDGIISSITGDFNGHFNQFGVFVTNDRLLRDGFFWTTAYAGGFYVHGKLARGAEGSLYVGRFNICEVVKITPAVPGFTVNGILLASDDGSELYSFDAAGRHLETRDGLTNTQIRSFAYDAAGRLVGITDRTGNSTQIVRDATGKPYAIVSPYGQTTSLTVDGAGDLIEVRNPAGEAYSASYYEGELLKTFSTPRGLASDFTYDADGRLTMDRGPSRSVFTLSSTRTDTSVTSQVTTAMGLVSTYQATVLPTSGFLRQTTLPGGIVATSLLGIDSSITNTSPDGTVVTMQRSADARYGVQAPVTASFTARTPSGRTLSMVSSRSITQSDLNDPLSLLTLTDRSTVTGRSWTTTYDRGGRTITSTTPTGLSATSVLDGLGRVSEIDSPGVLPLAITYDDRGRLQAVAQGDRTMSLSYDSNGYLSSVRDPLGRFTNLFNDPVGRVLNSSLQGNSTAITYDANGNITSIAPPGRSVHSFTYSGGDLEQDYMPPPVDGSGSGHVHTTRDLDQRIASIAADGVPPIVPSYDAVSGRIVNLAFSAGATSYSYVPASGRVASVTAPGGNTLSYTYDGPVLIATTHTNGPVTTTVNRTYDTAFRLQTETVTGGPTITYTYDNDSKLASAGNLIVTTSPSTGFVVGATLGTVGDSRTYDAFGDVQTYSVAAAGNTAYSANYGTRDQLARVVTKIETILGEQHVYSYSYDSRGRLADVTKDGAPQSHYEYHANGNRIVGPGLSSSPMYDAQDRLLSYGECTYAYRPNGSLQTKACPDGQTIYDYDSFGNLRGAALADGTQITYDIDGENRRIAKQINGVVVERFVYRNQLQPVAWLNGDGSLRAVFVYGEDANVPEYMVSGGNSYRLIRDQVGSVKLVVDSSGTVAQRIDYDEFGNVLADSAPGFQPFGFAGGLRDAHSGLVRFGARDYDPVTGRWTTKDPIRFNGGATNLYTYVDGDPINRRDPTGKVTPLGVRAAALCLAVDLAHGLETVLELNEYADEMLRIREQIKDLRNQCDGQPWDNDRIAKEEEIQQLELEYFKKSDELVRKRVVAYASHAFWAIGCLAVGALF